MAAQVVAFYCQNHDNVSKNNVFWVLTSNTWHNKLTYKAKVGPTFFMFILIKFVVTSFSSDYPCPTHMTRAVFNAEWKSTRGCWFCSTEVNTYEFLPSFCTFSNHVFRNDTLHNVWPVGKTTMKLTVDNINNESYFSFLFQNIWNTCAVKPLWKQWHPLLQRKLAVVKRWPLWGGSGVIWKIYQ